MVSFQDNLSCPVPDLYGSEVYCKAILSDSAGKFTGVLFIFLEKICFKFFPMYFNKLLLPLQRAEK